MAKSAQAFRTIREVADWLDVAAHVLRFWESKFNQIKPVKRAGGRRYYRPADMALVGGIKVLLHDRGLTIRGVQKMISEEGVDAVSALSPSVDAFLGNEEDPQTAPGDVWEADALADGTEIEGTLAEGPVETPDDEEEDGDAVPADPAPRPLLPPSDTAEGTLGRLAALATLPAEDRAFFAPQIEALARLRDRIATPPPSS